MRDVLDLARRCVEHRVTLAPEASENLARGFLELRALLERVEPELVQHHDAIRRTSIVEDIRSALKASSQRSPEGGE